MNLRTFILLQFGGIEGIDHLVRERVVQLLGEKLGLGNGTPPLLNGLYTFTDTSRVVGMSHHRPGEAVTLQHF